MCCEPFKLFSHQSSKTMSSSKTYSIADLRYIDAEELSPRVLAAANDPSSLAIVDVRDSDYIGGHIKGALNFPSGNFDWRLPELVRILEDKKVVVFHCMLSQQRGPAAALRYIRAKADKEAFEQQRRKTNEKEEDGERKSETEPKSEPKQEIFVLTGGFMQWQSKYGMDERLTEAYAADLWEGGAYY